MPLFGNGGLLGGGLAEKAKQAGVPTETKEDDAESYRKPMNVENFDAFGATLQSVGKAVEIARWEAPAGLARRWGYGRADTDANQGYLYGVFKNSDGETISGTLIFKWENSTGRREQVNDEADSADMNTPNRYDREQQRPYPEDNSKARASENEYLTVWFEPSTDPSDITNDYEIAASKSECRFPTTEYDVAGR
jgi:hypothetical protein